VRTAALAPLLALVPACRRVERFSLPPAPPSSAELPGEYAADFHDGVFGVLVLEAPETAAARGYPCAAPGLLDAVAGGYAYDPLSGHLVAEMKSQDGTTRLLVDGSFAGAELSGSFAVELLGVECERGAITLERR